MEIISAVIGFVIILLSIYLFFKISIGILKILVKFIKWIFDSWIRIFVLVLIILALIAR